MSTSEKVVNTGHTACLRTRLCIPPINTTSTGDTIGPLGVENLPHTTVMAARSSEIHPINLIQAPDLEDFWRVARDYSAGEDNSLVREGWSSAFPRISVR